MECGGIRDSQHAVLPQGALDQKLGDVRKFGLREERATPACILANLADEVPHDAAQDEDMAFAVVSLPWLLGSQPLDEKFIQAVSHGKVAVVEVLGQVEAVVEGEVEQRSFFGVFGQTWVDFKSFVEYNLKGELVCAEPRIGGLENACHWV